ncbi:MAG: hypothetical protein K9G67_00450 [Bacteroidales bacterium]|nr:hypothetical protein [Bacteroidales bacterium]MCF8344855.1 hypothetical protein [Bacteroidales bacterium]MCF8350815.1 hypothetical protein [Bacteroidales bacterium]MCF8374800.1 hypothetical protein [Bacteroidales bacterium]MCF8399796.1 hypothetical protein [Bacteroidales bacterium]
MKITTNNYEIYFIDYFDGNLSEAEGRELFAFLEQHPDLKAEFREFEQVQLPAEPILKFGKKESLKRKEIVSSGPVNENNYENFFVAFHEKDLNPEQQEHTLNFIRQNPELEKSFTLFSKTFFQSNANIEYPSKEKLKKHPFAIYKRVAYAVAASVILLLGWLFFFTGEEPIQMRRQVATLKKMGISKQTTAIETNQDLVRTKSLFERTAIVQPPSELYTPREDLSIAALDMRHSDGVFDPLDIIGDENILIELQFRDPRLNPSANENLLYTRNYEKDKTWAGRLLTDAFGKIKSIFESEIPEINSPRINLWEVAEAGVRSYNFLMDKDVLFKKITDKNGKVVSYALISNSVQYMKKVKE